MTTAILSITASIFLSAIAQAEVYPVLENYKLSAEKLVETTKTAGTTDEVAALQSGCRALMDQGAEVMKLYAIKNPNCEAQFNLMVSEIPQMQSMTIKELHDRYHDGVGLPPAPKHCYFGRSQVVHPAMNYVRAQGTMDLSLRLDMIEEFEEVINHLSRIQKNLDNPPN